jgi:CRISPR-associated protein Cmr2
MTLILLEENLAELRMQQANAAWVYLQQTSQIPMCLDCKSQRGGEHAALTSALAYCYLYDACPQLRSWLGLIRLAALYHTKPEQLQTLELTGDELTLVQYLAVRLNSHNSSLLATPVNFDPRDLEILERALVLSHLAAGAELTTNEQLDLEEMADAWIGLTMGGATKIKDYVFESSALPEIRGASALLDYINLELTPALFNRPVSQASRNRITLFQEGLAGKLVPEGLIYANGGEFLAFTPSSLAVLVAQRVEEIYNYETLTAQSVAVGEKFSLQEIRNGFKLRTVNGENQPLPFIIAALQNQNQPAPFSQLVGYLSVQRYRRREFNPLTTRSGEQVDPRKLAQFDTPPLARRCDSCDRRSAIATERRQREDEQNPPRLCESCARKAAVGQSLRKSKYGAWFKESDFNWELPRPEVLQSWEVVFNNYLQNSPDYLAVVHQDGWPNPRMAKDLSEIGKARMSKLENGRKVPLLKGVADGFIGVIYGDGNNMGGLLQQIATPADYRNFAETTNAVLIEAVLSSLARELRPAWSEEDQEWYHPFEILSVGGDDLYLFVPGGVALKVALAVSYKVEELLLKSNQQERFKAEEEYLPFQMERYLKETMNSSSKVTEQSKLSLSTGVLIAPENTPVFFMDSLVRQLLKSAKKKATSLRQKGYWGGTIDFMALKSVTMVSDRIESWRRQTLVRQFEKAVISQSEESRTSMISLTGRPYTLWEIEGLLQTVQALKEIDGPPRSQLYQLQEQLGQGERAGRVNYEYFLARSRDKGQKLAELFQRWMGNDSPPWRRGQDEKGQEILYNIIADLNELYDFTGGEGGPEQGEGDNGI